MTTMMMGSSRPTTTTTMMMGSSRPTTTTMASTATTSNTIATTTTIPGRRVIFPNAHLQHHGAACNSNPNVVTTILQKRRSRTSRHNDDQQNQEEQEEEKVEFVYASHLTLNVVRPRNLRRRERQRSVAVPSNDEHNEIMEEVDNEERVWVVEETLRTATQHEHPSSYQKHLRASNVTAQQRNVATVTAERVITCVKQIPHIMVVTRNNGADPTSAPAAAAATTATATASNRDSNHDMDVLVVGFSDGSLTAWVRMRPRNSISFSLSSSSSDISGTWKEHVLVPPGQDLQDGSSMSSSITDLDGYATLQVEQHDPNDPNTDRAVCATLSLLARLPPGVLQNRGISLSNNLCVACPLSKTWLHVHLVTCTSGGANALACRFEIDSTGIGSRTTMMAGTTAIPQVDVTIHHHHCILDTPANAVQYHTLGGEDGKDGDDGIFLVGTAMPRHNKIHVMKTTATTATTAATTTAVAMKDATTTSESPEKDRRRQQQHQQQPPPIHVGSLSGHEDWITCFDWTTVMATFSPSSLADQLVAAAAAAAASNYSSFLASGSQDSKIRLWKWVTTTTTNATASSQTILGTGQGADDDIEDDDDEDDDDDDEEMVEGEARLEVVHGNNGNTSSTTTTRTTSVFLEALLIGHEDKVTSVAWHPCPQRYYGRDLVLVSASMDRTIFLWSEHEESGVWTPVTRVGSAAGILGGSVGSSLLGYLNVQIDPLHGRWIMGHAYGGALHFFSCETSKEWSQLMEQKDQNVGGINTNNALSAEERAAFVQWKAQPCLTGHFAEVTDLCWEASAGEYLLTVGNDQTCRLWAPLASPDDTWVEIARPQVHGYNLSAIASLSTKTHKHLLVTGADEKEIRVFDGTLSFVRLLHRLSICTTGDEEEDENVTAKRFERSYIPALGLTNKASAADGADEDTGGASTSDSLLPLERDLGSTSVWPEIRKLYGHNSEIARLASTLESRTCLYMRFETTFYDEILVASSTKARDVETASIRLWHVGSNRCVQTLKGGHRSTVTALCFSPDGSYLASSGKDRRLCLWSRQDGAELSKENESNGLFGLASAIDSSHKRIVWSVQFCPYDPTVLASGSRDGTLKLWKIQEDKNGGLELMEYAKFVPKPDRNKGGKAEAVTSLAFAPVELADHKEKGLLAIGFENGLVQLWKVPLGPTISTIEENDEEKDATAALEPALYLPFRSQFCHIAAVNKMAWRPITEASTKHLTLATCSDDHGCRIFQVQVAPARTTTLDPSLRSRPRPL